MHCAALLFARRVNTEATTSLEGIYDQITAPSFPAVVDDLVIWARLFYSADEAGAHEVSLGIVDGQSSNVIGTTSGQLILPERPERLHPSNDLTINLTNAELQHAGEYEFRLSVDGQLVGVVWLTVDSPLSGEFVV